MTHPAILRAAFDLIVIGGGPAGAVAALLAARDGQSVALIDPGATPFRLEGLSPRLHRWLYQAGLGALIGPIAIPARRVSLWGQAPGNGRADNQADDGAPSADRTAALNHELIVNRAALDAALRRAAVQAGATRFRAVATPIKGGARLADGTHLSARMVFDARGRKALTTRARALRGPPTIAIGAALLPSCETAAATRILALDEGWLWIAQTGALDERSPCTMSQRDAGTGANGLAAATGRPMRDSPDPDVPPKDRLPPESETDAETHLALGVSAKSPHHALAEDRIMRHSLTVDGSNAAQDNPTPFRVPPFGAPGEPLAVPDRRSAHPIVSPAGWVQVTLDAADPKGRAPLDRLRAMLAAAVQQGGLAHLPQITGQPLIRDAAPVLPAPIDTLSVIEIGDAVAAMDPLSGHGMFWAVSSALAATAVRRTLDLRDDADSRAMALRFLNQRQDEVYLRQARLGRDFIRAETGRSAHPFWAHRRDFADSADPAPDPATPTLTRRIVVENGHLTEGEVLCTPYSPAGVAWLGPHPAAELFRAHLAGVTPETMTTRFGAIGAGFADWLRSEMASAGRTG